MIMSWFTQPPGKTFSSYYQYDTVTKNFTRIRLELNRADPDGTFISYQTERFVGFSAKRYRTSGKNLRRWSVNEKNELCYENVALPTSQPNEGVRTYDCSLPMTRVHQGRGLTNDPILPEGIKPKHLALLANETFGGDEDATIKLTESNAGDAAVASALQGRVCEILGVPATDFPAITDDVIIAKLTSQVKIIRDIAGDPSKANVKDWLGEAGRVMAEISARIGDGLPVLNEELQTALGSLQLAIDTAGRVQSTDGMGHALTEISYAETAVQQVIGTIAAAQREAVASEFSKARDALIEVRGQVTEWQKIEVSYKSLENAGTIEDYTKEILPEYEEIARPLCPSRPI